MFLLANNGIIKGPRLAVPSLRGDFMSLTINTKTFSLDAHLSPDGARYAGPNQSYSGRDHLDLKRTFPKPTDTFAGNARAQAKFSRTLTDGTDPVGEAVVDIRVQLPAAGAAAEVTALVADVASYVGGADFLSLVNDLDITY